MGNATVYVLGKQISYDPQKNYGLMDFSGGGLRILGLNMEKNTIFLSTKATFRGVYMRGLL